MPCTRMPTSKRLGDAVLTTGARAVADVDAVLPREVASS